MGGYEGIELLIGSSDMVLARGVLYAVDDEYEEGEHCGDEEDDGNDNSSKEEDDINSVSS
jgi:hypothetical protein